MEQINNKDNSNEEVISIKSIDEKENNNNIIDIIEKSNKINISFKSLNDSLKIDRKSIKKIFSYITEKEKLSDMYIDHITINLFDFNQNNNNNQNLELISNDANCELVELDIKYKTILDKATIFHINLEKNYKNNNEESEKIKLNANKKRTISRKSLIKIFNFLNESIISMCDYINIVILYLNDEIENDFAKWVIEEKILGKYNKKPQKIDFDGKKSYNCIMDIPLKNNSQNIYTLDMLFSKVLDSIDDYDKESSFSDNINNLIIPRKSIDEDLIKVVNVSFIEEGILTNDDELENDGLNNENKKKRKKIKHSREPSNSSLKDEGHCNKNLCKGLCFIF